MSRKHAGFTLIELLVVIAIIAILIALLVPAVQKVRAAAARTQCVNNLKQIALGLQDYHGVWKVFPTVLGNPGGSDQARGWMTCLLPYIDQQPIWDLMGTNAPAAYATLLAVYVCPADPRPNSSTMMQADGYGMADYVGISGYDVNATTDTQMGIIRSGTPLNVPISQVTDGTSNTVIVGERPFSADYYWGWWAQPSEADTVWGSQNNTSGNTLPNGTSGAVYVHPNGSACGPGPYLFGGGPLNVNDPCSINYLWSNHPGGGANFAFADGTVRWITYTANQTVLNLSTYMGGETNNDLGYD